MLAIINKEINFGTLNGVIKTNVEIMEVISEHIENGTAELLIDTEDTLMYRLLIFKESAP